ncbi:MAG: hypothetical protein AAF502_12620 [Bacteroidota bacterium]
MLNRLIEFLRYRNRKIYQFSPVRSGSTLVFNLLQDLFPNHKIIKCHKIEPDLANRFPVVSTYRNPLDTLASTFQALDLELNDGLLKTQAEKHKSRGLDNLLEIWGNPNVLKLQYESFYKDFDLIFDAFESFFSMRIGEATRKTLSQKYHIEKVEKEASKFKDFKAFDKATHWHGKHISEQKGAIGYHVSYFTEEQAAFLQKEFRPYLEKLGYL